MISLRRRFTGAHLTATAVIVLAPLILLGCDQSPSSASASESATDHAQSDHDQHVDHAFEWPADPSSGKLLQVGKYPKDFEQNASLWKISRFEGSVVPAHDIDPLHVRMVSASDVEDMFDSGDWVLLDVRKDKDLAQKGTIPGAVHYEYKHEGAELRGTTFLTREVAMELVESVQGGVIVFCNGGKCPRSFNTCLALVQEWGIPGNRVAWFRDGAPAWDRSPLLQISAGGSHAH